MALTWYNLGVGPTPWSDATSYSSSAHYVTSTYTTGAGLSSYRKGQDNLYSVTYFDNHVSASYLLSGVESYGGTISGGSQSNTYSYTYYRSGGDTAGGLTENSSESGRIFYPTAGNGTIEGTTYSHFVQTNIYTGAAVPLTTSSYLYNTHGDAVYVSNDAYGVTRNLNAYESKTILPRSDVTTQSYTSGYYSTPADRSIIVTITDTSQRFYPVSTALTSGAGTDTATYASTREASSSDTYTVIGFVGITSSVAFALTASYLPGKHYLIPVVRAEASEGLRMCSVAASTIGDVSDFYGATTNQTTLSSAVLSGIVSGSAVASDNSTVTRTVTSFYITNAYKTFTVSAYVAITLTEQSWNGWVGAGSSTESRTLYGVSTGTVSLLTSGTATTEETKSGAVGRTTEKTQTLYVDWVFSETITGIGAGGTTAAYAIENQRLSQLYKTYLDYLGNFGDTVTTYQSPVGQAFGGGYAGLTRMDRVNGYQSPLGLGSTGNQGRALTASTPIFLGNGGLSEAARDSILTPAYGSSTAETAGTSYSYTLGNEGTWSVTTATTGVSSTLTTTSTGSFTATMGVVSPADRFQWADLGAVSSYATLAGGAHARMGGAQNATLGGGVDGGGYGYRYTLGDNAGTTSSQITLTAAYATVALGSSIIAVETFRAGQANPSLQPGLPIPQVFTYFIP